MISPGIRDDLARLDGASAGPIRVRSFGFCTGERMPAERTTMRHVREVLRLTAAGVGLNEIARRVGVAPSTVRLTLKRLARAGLSWPLPGEMTDNTLPGAVVQPQFWCRLKRFDASPEVRLRSSLSS